MKKQDLIDALKAFNFDSQGMTMEAMANKLKQLRIEKEKKDEPTEPQNLKVVEVTRSYSKKVNLGNYQSEDYFCSRKAEVAEGDDVEEISNWLAYQCKVDVESSIRVSKDKPF